MKLARHLPRFRKAYETQAILCAHEQWTRSQVESEQLARVNAIWKRAIAHVPYYRQLAVEQSLPGHFHTLEHFTASVPLLGKDRVRERPSDFVSEIAERGRWCRTGGSTGLPMNVFWGKSGHLEILRARYRFYAQWGVDVFDRTVFLWGHGGGAQPSLRGQIDLVARPLLDRVRNRLRLSAYKLSPEALRSHLRQIVQFRPAAIYGYSSAVYLLAREALAMGVSVPSLKAIFLTAEPARPHHVNTIERAFGVPAVVEYGSVETVFLVGQAPDGTLRVREDAVFLETLPRIDGRFDIVPTVLTNPSFPLLRYRIEDVTDAPLEKPETGFAILRNVVGRDNDFLQTPSGELLHPAEVEEVFTTFDPAIRRFHVHQGVSGHVTVSIEVDTLAHFTRGKELHAVVDSLLGGFPVQMKIVTLLPPSLSGKHRHVVSDFAKSAVLCN